MIGPRETGAPDRPELSPRPHRLTGDTCRTSRRPRGARRAACGADLASALGADWGIDGSGAGPGRSVSPGAQYGAKSTKASSEPEDGETLPSPAARGVAGDNAIRPGLSGCSTAVHEETTASPSPTRPTSSTRSPSRSSRAGRAHARRAGRAPVLRPTRPRAACLACMPGGCSRLGAPAACLAWGRDGAWLRPARAVPLPARDLRARHEAAGSSLVASELTPCTVVGPHLDSKWHEL